MLIDKPDNLFVKGFIPNLISNALLLVRPFDLFHTSEQDSSAPANSASLQ